MAPRVSLSIVVCTYNRCESLVATLASLNGCELPPECSLELLVIDNNGTDDTAAVCDAFARIARVPFRRILERRQGLSFARNRGIHESLGDVVVFTDDDVLVNAEWLTAYASEFDEQGADCAFGRVYPDWRGRRPDWFSDELRPVYALLDYGNERLIVTDRAKEFFGANFAVRRDLLLTHGGFDVRLGRTKGKLFIGEETRLFLMLLSDGNRIVYNPAIVVHHVIEESRKTRAYVLRYYRDTAESQVYLSLQGTAGRRLMGVPLYSLRALMSFYLCALPRACVLLLRCNTRGLFALRLDHIRFSRIMVLYTREWIRRFCLPQAVA